MGGTGPIEYDGLALLQRDIDNLKAALAGRWRGRRVSPGRGAGERVLASKRVRQDRRGVRLRVANALRTEDPTIVDSGLLLQVDDAVLVHEYDSMLARGQSVEDYRRWAQVRIDALNHALRGIPEERVRYHVCWSWHGPHVYDPPLAEVVEFVLQAHARYYAIEQANPRHEHEWRLWESQKLPQGKYLFLASSRTILNIVEHPELVAQRLTRLARLVGRKT